MWSVCARGGGGGGTYFGFEKKSEQLINVLPHLHQEDEDLVQVGETGSNFHVEAQLLLKVPAKVDSLDEAADEVSGLPAMVLKTQGTAEEGRAIHWNLYQWTLQGANNISPANLLNAPPPPPPSMEMVTYFRASWMTLQRYIRPFTIRGSLVSSVWCL